MYGLIQAYLMIFFIFIYLIIAAIPIVIFMAAVTHLNGDKAYFRKKIDKYAEKQGWR